jgi:hypothetical protein
MKRPLVEISVDISGVIMQEVLKYGAELCSMQSAVEEAITIQYMFWSFGSRVTNHVAHLETKNMASLLNMTLPDSALKNKHIVISYHYSRENSATGILSISSYEARIDTFIQHTWKILFYNYWCQSARLVLKRSVNFLRIMNTITEHIRGVIIRDLDQGSLRVQYDPFDTCPLTRSILNTQCKTVKNLRCSIWSMGL